MPMPTDIGVIDLMIGFPEPTAATLRLPARQPARPRVARRVRVPRAVHVQERAEGRGAVRPGDGPARADGQVRHRAGHDRRRRRARSRRASKTPSGRSRSIPTASSGACEVDPNRGMDAVRDLHARGRGARREGGDRVPVRAQPAGADQRQEVLPDLRQVHRARHPDLRVRGCARAAGAVRAAVRRPDRRGVLVLPRAQVRHPPRLRAVGRPRGEAAAQVAEPLLLDVARSRRSTTRRTSSTSRTPAAPTR